MSDAPSPTFKRLLLTIAAIPVGLFVGIVLATIAVGAPHSVPGFLLHAPEPVRNRVSFWIFVGTPVALVVRIWWTPLRTLFGRK